jgi:hypothetical protein
MLLHEFVHEGNEGQIQRVPEPQSVAAFQRE